MTTQIETILKQVLPNTAKIIVAERTLLGDKYIKIMFAISDYQINNVAEQFPQCVSLILHLETLELSVQIFGGMGGNRIYLKPNLDNPQEKYLAMVGVKIPFRKPKPELKNVLACVQKFAENWLIALKENKDRLMYSNYVDYNNFLK